VPKLAQHLQDIKYLGQVSERDTIVAFFKGYNRTEPNARLGSQVGLREVHGLASLGQSLPKLCKCILDKNRGVFAPWYC